MKPRAPRSLLWRLGALVLAVTFVSLVLHVTVISVWLRPLGERMFAQVVARAQITRELLQAVPAPRRDALIVSLSDDDFRLIRGAPKGPVLSMLPAPLGPRLLERLRPDFTIVGEPIEPLSLVPLVLRLVFAVDDEPWHIEMHLQPPTQALLGTGIGWLALAAAAVGASFLMGLRFIVGPIRQVAARLTTQGAALQSLTLPAGASAEVQSLVESFNRLADRVHTADRTKQQLLAGVSHDLRTPLARLRLRIETQCEPAVANAAEVELRAIEHIVSQFLAYVHGDSAAVRDAPTSLLATARQVVASYAEQGVEIRLLTAADDMPIGALALQRLLSNLIDNALAHGQSPIDVNWRQSAAGERELCIWDHGPGLSERQFKAALEPFVRLSKDAAIGHCGLGLAIVAQIAQQWQARLECRRDEVGRFGIAVLWRAAEVEASTAVIDRHTIEPARRLR